MDPVGIAGLGGLFASVMDAIDRAKDYRSFAADSRTLDAQFDGFGAQLAHWGKEIGIDHGQFPADHKARLDPQTLSAAEQLLQVAKEVLALSESSRARAKVLTGQPPPKPASSRLHKLGWALGGKADRSKNVRLFGEIVHQLCELVPGQPTGGKQNGHAQQIGFTPSEAYPTLQDFLSEIRQTNSQIIAERKTYMQHELATWLLGHTVPNETYHESIEKRLPGTCNWIFDQQEFLDWAKKDVSGPTRPLLWIHGQAGFGKTVLCAQIVQKLMEKGDRPMAYFFFSSNFDSRDDPYAALRSCVLQLTSNYPVAFELACDKWSERTDQAMASRLVIIQLLGQIIEEIPWCTLVIDGLDECTAVRKEQGNVERFLFDIRDIMADTTRILIVSRDEPEIRQALECDGHDILSQFKIWPDHVKDDTNTLSCHIVNKRLPNKTEEIRKDLSERLNSRCDGQFIWLMMQQGSLRKGSNFMALKRAIDETPTGLDQLYKRNWDSILAYGERDREQAFALLRWAAFSSRPLTIGEIAEAIVLDETLEDFPINELPDSIDDDYINTEIVGLCGPLVEVRSKSADQQPQFRTIHIAHFSIREYLICKLPIGNLRSNESLRVSSERAHESFLARLCLKYITCRSTWNATGSSNFIQSLRGYAGISWSSCIEYSKEDEKDSKLLDLASNFMTETHPCWSPWTQWFDEKYDDEEAIKEKKQVSGPSEPLYYALRLRLHEFASKLVLSRSSCGGYENKGRSALHLACLTGNRKVATALIGGAASLVNSRGLGGRTVLLNAVLSYDGEMVQMLLEMGADVSIPDDEGWVPLAIAALVGYDEILSLLLDRGADLANSTVNLGKERRLLSLAAQGGYLEIVGILLHRGADISAVDEDGWTPLGWAASYGNFEIVRLLLEKGADVSVACERGMTPIHIAALKGHIEVVYLLLEGGADHSITDNEGCTPLYRAAQFGHLEIVCLFLDRGADHSAKSYRGASPLSHAASNNHVEVVRLLLDRGVDHDITDNGGLTPLVHAATADRLDIVMLLLERLSRDPVERNDRKQISMDESSARSNTPGLRQVALENFINRADCVGRGALFYACDNGNTEIVRLLITNAHLEPMMPDYFALTPLYAAVIRGHYGVVELLLEFMGRALRSVSSDVSRLLRDHCRKYNIPLELEDLPPNSPWASWEKNVSDCDACMRPTPLAVARYSCRECVVGSRIFICQECIESGVWCLDPSHRIELFP
ncbi:unnamed protein product [Clonostachys rhizophaga]|uniref:Uncharacterized protein n=1 Tax=Clonostachys rhizophaga TaxID=160324 RepID=A0A9N9VMB2_9HYPO|nr:unnamed protein product [Clonostachys rhizophaga]